MDILLENLKTRSYDAISNELNVSKGTVKRWFELKNVPESYRFELMKMANIPINYSDYSSKVKDQFYTPIPIAKHCFDKLVEILRKYGEDENNFTYIEPSAGSGNFLKVLPSNRFIGFDIEPKADNIEEMDYLTWKPNDLSKRYIVIGNPPFGLRGQLALKFINHSSNFAEYVGFILPQLFESDGKGVPRKRVKGFHLIHSEKLDTDFIEPDNKRVLINCIFQIWSKNNQNDKYLLKKLKEDILKVYSLSDGGTPSSTRNKKMFNKCHIYLPSTCFGKENMKYYNSFDELPNRKGYGIVFHKDINDNITKFKSIDWSSKAFLSTNSAYNIRSSQIAELFF